jgi:hypothetical protein
MVAPLKTRGLDELNSLQARARRLYGLSRISKEDFDFIDKRLSEVEERIIEMRERMTDSPTF